MYMKRMAGVAIAAGLGVSALTVGGELASAAPLKPQPLCENCGTTILGGPWHGPLPDAPGPGGPGPGPGGPGPGGPGPGPGGPGTGTWWTRDRVDPELGRTGRGDRVERGLAARDLVDRDRVDPELGRTGRGDRVERGLAARDLVDRDRAAGPGGPGPGDRDLVVDRDRAGRDLDRGLADRCRGALTIGVMPRSVVPWMRLAASAHTTTARPLRHGQGDSAGTMGLLPVGRRQTGSARHLQVVGTVLRLPVVGTTRGTGRTAA